MILSSILMNQSSLWHDNQWVNETGNNSIDKISWSRIFLIQIIVYENIC